MNRTIEIRLPEGQDLSEHDLRILRTACEALVGLGHGLGADGSAKLSTLAAQGWEAQTSLTWVARAERDRQSEEALGETPGEALRRLCQLIRLHSVEGCP